ncbi:MAG: CBS domain-containing protein [Mariprofundus sp.]|nr:CBS domain-containing protein [Mariprofundus sp.]
MHARDIMTTDVVVCHPEQTVGDIAAVLNEKSFRMIPVVDAERKILGAVNSLSVLASLVPSYIVTGDLKSIPYAPDIGLLRKHYETLLQSKVRDVMDDNPTIVSEDESLLSVTAALITYDRFEYALVADDDERLVGIISSSDILRRLAKSPHVNSDDA